jgi:hypothetical protein
MGDGQNTGESYNNNTCTTTTSLASPENNDIGGITGHITLIWSELHSAWKLQNLDRHGKEEELQCQIRLDLGR